MCQVFIKMSWIRSSLVLFALLTKHCYQQLKNKMRTLELPWKISFGSQKNIHYRDELYALWTFYWLSMFFQWPSKTHCIKSSYTMSDNEETALSLKNFTIQTIPTISPDRILNAVMKHFWKKLNSIPYTCDDHLTHVYNFFTRKSWWGKCLNL